MTSLLLNMMRSAGPTIRSAGNRFATKTTTLQRCSAIVVCSGQSFHSFGDQRRQQQYKQLPSLVSLQTTRGFFRKAGSSSLGKKDEPPEAALPPEVEPAKLGLFARFRKMYKEYWYVLVPVHCVTSVFWFGGFYYAATTGVDVIAALEWIGVSEKLITPVRDSSLGHIATAYLLYKIATPARYTVTLGGTTVSIKYLVQWGYIKPIPTKAAMVQMYMDKKENIKDRIAEKKQDLQDRKQSMMDSFSGKDKTGQNEK
uniref:Putative conserved plasma membrane protein n=1 Tax=Culex tarsalis TaxID=7177 RepID=A0A1Q3F9F4_CULTA